jgi:hypothetical protein
LETSTGWERFWKNSKELWHFSFTQTANKERKYIISDEIINIIKKKLMGLIH